MFRFVCGDSVGITGRRRACGDSAGPPQAAVGSSASLPPLERLAINAGPDHLWSLETRLPTNPICRRIWRGSYGSLISCANCQICRFWVSLGPSTRLTLSSGEIHYRMGRRRSDITGHVFRANKYRAWLRPRLPDRQGISALICGFQRSLAGAGRL